MPLDSLVTLRDFFRWAISRFTQAKLVYGHGTQTAWDEAAFLILEGLHLPIDQPLELLLEARLLQEERVRLAHLIEERVRTRKPAAYLLHKAYIQGIPFYVDERVIVPRSFLGDLLLGPLCEAGVMGFWQDPPKIRRVLDLCTGSGCLAILAAHVFPDAQIEAVDLSQDALEVATRNVHESGFEDRITLFQGNLFEPLGARLYDLILTNPPYVDANSMAHLPPEYRAEPSLALDGGEDGLVYIHEILKKAPAHLTSHGGLLCEIGRGRALLEMHYPYIPFTWLDTPESEGEVFFLTAQDMQAAYSLG